MHVELYERIWMWIAGALIVVFLGVIVATAANGAIAPPSHIETVDPTALDRHPEFSAPAVRTNADGSVLVTVVASTFSFAPDPIEVPAGRPVMFRLTSSDVIHGFQVVGTNANAMVVPGYVSQFTVTFKTPGEYAIACNEYCGIMHHQMVGKLIVTAGDAVMSRPHTLAAAHLGVAVAAFGVASAMGVMQGLSVADVDFPQRSESLYYVSVTAHGVLMALVFTTFFIMGLGYALSQATLGRIVGRRTAWFAFWLALVGTVAAAYTILTGQSTVLYTFYPPLKAHPLFYIGATLLVVGSWIWGGVIIASIRSWRKEHPGQAMPLAMHGTLANIIIWYLATTGLAIEVLFMLIPWSLGWVATIDPMLARTYFWWFGHPLVYFWLLPAYVLWYTVLPKVAGGRLFSDPLARMVFILFVLLSTPVGFHHQFADPGISANWKLAHTITTFAILYPSLVTAFTVLASLETAGRLKGAKGLFNWIGRLPWGDPFFASIALAMIAFTFGGFGGAINAVYAMNTMVHNTAWIMGHFHITLGTTATLSFMGATYWLLPRILGRELRLPWLARIQPYLWFLGMSFFSISYHVAGLRGLPRRVYSAALTGEYGAQWHGLTVIAAVGGVILFLSAMAYVAVFVSTWTTGRRIEPPAFEFAVPLRPVAGPSIWDRFGLWTIVAAVLILLAYAYPIITLIGHTRYGSPPFQPF